jgi:hypothetical protein
MRLSPRRSADCPPLPRICIAIMTPQMRADIAMRLSDVAEAHLAVTALVSLLSEGD